MRIIVISRRCYERCVFGARRDARGAAGLQKKKPSRSVARVPSMRIRKAAQELHKKLT